MANRTYLHRSDFPWIYPGHENPAFDEERDIVAGGANQIPLLWIALFRVDDLCTRQLQSDTGEALLFEAPLADADRAVHQLHAALPLYFSLFPELKTLPDDAALLVEAIQSFSGQFVTVEWDELESMVQDDPAPFRAIVRRQLEFLSSPTNNVAPVHRRMFERFRRPRTQEQLQRELLAAHSTLTVERNPRFVPDLIGESWLKEWPCDAAQDAT